MKLITTVEPGKSKISISLEDTVFVLGSCFADNVGEKMVRAGFNVCSNPFGTLYNPLSIAKAVRRLACPEPFTEADCVEMGSGAGLVCSFSHHTSFARSTAQDFLKEANASLLESAGLWRRCNKVIISLGTVYCYFHNGEVVSNCLKRPQSEFERRALSLGETSAALEAIVRECRDKDYIFTVSPIRHMSDGAHANQLSKSTLLLASESLCQNPGCSYFPAYEILLDELRDYRFYAEDLCHPSGIAAQIIWEKFLESTVCPEDLSRIEENLKAWRRSQHRPHH